MDKTKFAYQQKLNFKHTKQQFWDYEEYKHRIVVAFQQRCEKAKKIQKSYQSRANDD